MVRDACERSVEAAALTSIRVAKDSVGTSNIMVTPNRIALMSLISRVVFVVFAGALVRSSDHEVEAADTAHGTPGSVPLWLTQYIS